jgi:hypothetical protein
MLQRRLLAVAITSMALAGIDSAAQAPKRGEKPGWVALFDGKSLDGWKAAEHPEAWTVKDGTLSCNGERSHLFYVGPVQQARFGDFEAEFEVLAHTGANSGVYFHTAWLDKGWPTQGFEMQVNNTQPIFPGDSGDPYRENKKTGSLYGIRNTYKALARDNAWFTLKLRVQGPRVRIHVGDVLVVDYLEPEGEVAGLATPLSKLVKGTFALQCHDGRSQVQYRRIAVRPLPPPASAIARAPNPDPAFAERYRLARDNFPLVDLRALDASKAGELEALQAKQRSGEGLFVGVTATAGRNGDVKTDAEIRAFANRYTRQPVFAGLRVFERRWNSRLSSKAIAAVDYVLIDGEQISARLPHWGFPEAEVEVRSIVDATIRALDNEPIDVYGAATFVPDSTKATLTDTQRQRLIDAAARNGVAIEINGRLKLPDEAFVREAKAAGLKFTLGECALGTPAGDYCFDLREKVGLGYKDMLEPTQQPTRASRESSR